MTGSKALNEIEEVLRADSELQEAFEERRYAREAGLLLNAMRERAGLTKKVLAKRIGVQPPRINEVENAEGRDGPTYRFMCKAADACGFRWPVTINDLSKKDEESVGGAERVFYLVKELVKASRVDHAKTHDAQSDYAVGRHLPKQPLKSRPEKAAATIAMSEYTICGKLRIDRLGHGYVELGEYESAYSLSTFGVGRVWLLPSEVDPVPKTGLPSRRGEK